MKKIENMMQIQRPREFLVKLSSSIFAFFLSLIFTFSAYYLVREKMMQGKFLIYVVGGLAILQAFVQMYFFLHLGQGSDSSSRGNLLMLFIMLVCFLILVVGSLWIMYHLNNNLMMHGL